MKLREEGPGRAGKQTNSKCGKWAAVRSAVSLCIREEGQGSLSRLQPLGKAGTAVSRRKRNKDGKS